MATFFSKPSVKKPMRFVAAYLMFAVFAAGGILISESFRQNVFDICKFLKVDADTVYILYSWGSYLIYLPYVLSLAIIEGYLYTGAKTGKLYPRIKRLLTIEGSIGVTSFLASQLMQYLIKLQNNGV
jgi:hypothetical protein